MASRSGRPRFSLLLLSYGERYLEDRAVSLEVYRPLTCRRLEGRLKIASGSLTFCPDDREAPLLRIPLRECPSPPSSWKAETGASRQDTTLPALYLPEEAAAHSARQDGCPGRSGEGKGSALAAITPPAMVGARAASILQSRAREVEDGAADAEDGPVANAELAGFELRPCTILHKRDLCAPFASYMCEPSSPPLRFRLLHAPLEPLLALLAALHEALTMSEADAEALLRSVTTSLAQPFDLTALIDPLEAHLLELPATRISPMVNAPAITLLTESRIYLQSAADAAVATAVSHWPLSSLRRVVRRRHLMRHVAVEMEFKAPSLGGKRDGAVMHGPAGSCETSDSLLLAFGSHDERERFLGLLEEVVAKRGLPPLPPPPGTQLAEMTVRWQHGLLSNYDYLCFLNDCAGRSLNDLAQYPVMPWVLSDYSSETIDLSNPSSYRDLSKPIGALNSERLRLFRDRYAAMAPGEAFMYGTHFSAPAFVAYFLLRQKPELTLHLHAGRYDDADRLFFSIREAWSSCLRSTSDVKELIPQFYAPELHQPRSASFLVNARALPLGKRSNGETVGDVQLPPWAASPHHFVSVCRDALESEIASAALHGWIDLIFGYRQRGAAAVDADNVFCPQAYEGAVDMEGLPCAERRVLELQLNEFGQMPTQLFHAPHPRRRAGAANGSLLTEAQLFAAMEAASGVSSSSHSRGNGGAADAPAALSGSAPLLSSLRLVQSAKLQFDPVSSIFLAEDHITVCATGGSTVRVYCPRRRRLLRCAEVGGGSHLSSCVQLPGLDLLCAGTWDGDVLLYSVGRDRVTEAFRRAHSAGVSGLALGAAGVLSGSWDTTLQLWGVTPSGLCATPLWRSGPSATAVTSVALHASEPKLAACGMRDGTVALWDIRSDSSTACAAWCHPGGEEISNVGLAEATNNGADMVVSASHDGSVLVGGHSMGPSVLRVEGGGPPQLSVCAIGGGALSAGEGGIINVWCLRRMALEATLRVATCDGEGPPLPSVQSMHLAMDARTRVIELVLGLGDGSCEIWTTANDFEHAARNE